MRFYLRTSPRTGVSIGFLGLWILWPLYLTVYLTYLLLKGLLVIALLLIIGLRMGWGKLRG